MQKQLETVEKVSNSVAETHMKLCPKHSKAALDKAEEKEYYGERKSTKKLAANAE